MDTTLQIINASPDCEIVNSRVINFSRDLIFRAWTDPYHLKNWWGPKGFTNTFSEFDLRPGGTWKFVMHGPDKGHFPNEVVFVKIEKPELIVLNHISSPQFQIVALFEEVSYNKTNLTFKMVFGTAEECEQIKAFAVDKNEENLDRLEMELGRMLSGKN